MTRTCLALDRALSELEQFDEQQCRIVELRYFAGLTIEETAEALRISPSTVKREWEIARTWLYQRMKDRGVMDPCGSLSIDSLNRSPESGRPRT